MTTEYTDDEFRARLWMAYQAGVFSQWETRNWTDPNVQANIRKRFETWFAKEFPEHTHNLSVIPHQVYAGIMEHTTQHGPFKLPHNVCGKCLQPDCICDPKIPERTRNGFCNY